MENIKCCKCENKYFKEGCSKCNRKDVNVCINEIIINNKKFIRRYCISCYIQIHNISVNEIF